MRVFLDTNVLASAFATRGLCADILREVITFQQFVCSETVLKELEQVMSVKFSVPSTIRKEIEDFLRAHISIAGKSSPLELALAGKADRVIVSEALSADAEVFVTGDKEILSLGQVEEMRILSPRQFWELLQDRPA